MSLAYWLYCASEEEKKAMSAGWKEQIDFVEGERGEVLRRLSG